MSDIAGVIYRGRVEETNDYNVRYAQKTDARKLDDIIGDINIPTVPQVGGVTKVLRRSNRNVKVTVLNNYRLILKPKL